MAAVNNAAVNMGVQIVTLFPLDIYPEVRLLGRMVVVFLVF